jgi:anthranilate synthase component 1
MSKQKYMDLVEQAKEHIRAGDVFQVVVSQRLTVPLLEPPFELYRRLRRVNPSPYMFYLNFGERQLVGASPEMLVKLEAGHITTRPIAGTRPRGYDAADDDRLAAELLADNKECAEHTMLVDLGRNDLGRVCVPGTVTVERFKQVEMFSHVMHIVSDVGGTVDANFGPIDALKACFPAGTLSGAPKVRAMEIIQELEGDNRGPYAGAVGYIDFHGNMDTCITIRTMSIADQEVTVQAGAGIVYDSVPETEYAETMHKAKALIKVMAAGEEDVRCQ